LFQGLSTVEKLSSYHFKSIMDLKNNVPHLDEPTALSDDQGTALLKKLQPQILDKNLQHGYPTQEFLPTTSYVGALSGKLVTPIPC